MEQAKPKKWYHYLKDAVFNPLCMVDKKPFLQEGWHLELLNKEEELKYAISVIFMCCLSPPSSNLYKHHNL